MNKRKKMENEGKAVADRGRWRYTLIVLIFARLMCLASLTVRRSVDPASPHLDVWTSSLSWRHTTRTTLA